MASIVMVLLGDIRYDGRVRKEIQTLRKANHQVELVVSNTRGNDTGGEDLGIPVHYVPMTLWGNPIMNFLSQLRFNKAAAEIIRNLHPSHIHCHDLNTLLAGMWAKETSGAKLIFDAHELMPESMGGIREAVWDRIEKRCLKWCDGVIMPEKNRIAYFKQKYREVGEVLLLENFPCRADIQAAGEDVFRRIYPIGKEQKIILHTGLIAAKRHVEELIDSMAVAGDEYALVLLGRTFKGYEQTLKTRIRKSGLENQVFLHHAVPHSEILKYMAAGDIGTAFYRNINLNNYYCASNKLFEYIALAKPVLTNNYPGLLDAVEQFGQGVCLDDITPANLAKAYSLASDRHTVRPGRKMFFWEHQEGKLRAFYECQV